MSISASNRRQATVGGVILAIALIGAMGLYLSRTSHPASGAHSVTGNEPAPEEPGVRDTPFRVGVLYWSANIEGQIAMRRGLEDEVERIRASNRGPGISILPRVAGDGAEGRVNQIRQMRELLGLGVDAIVVQPTDNAALVEPLREANRLGVPVVAYDQYIEGGELAAYVTSDNRQAGLLDGEYIAHRFDDTHEIQLVLVEYPHVSSTVERLDGFLSALEGLAQPFKILATYKAVEPESGHIAGQRILQDFPKPGSVDVVFTVNDGGGLSVVEALAAAGRTEIMVATIDGDPKSVDNIKAGRLTVIDAAQFCGPIGETAIRSAYAILMGEQVPPLRLIPTFPITKETLDRYPGWMGPLPDSFEKPWASPNPTWSPELREVAGR